MVDRQVSPSKAGSAAEADISAASSAPPESQLGFSERRYVWAWLLVALSVVLVLFLSFSLWRQAQAAARAQFADRTDEVTTAILDRMETYEQVLRGGLGLFEASSAVERQEWKTYVESLQLQRHYPGIQGMGYSLWLRPDELATHIAAIRAEGFPGYRVHPEEPRAEYTAIVYLEPFDERNRQAFGYDMWSQAVRRAAMSRARDTGETTISGRVTLVQEIDADVQAGFLMYLPHYRGSGPDPDIGARRAALAGFVYSPFRMRDLMEGVVGDLADIRLMIYDGDASSPENLMFDSAAGSDDIAAVPRFEDVEALQIRGANWILKFSALPGFRRGDAADSQPPIVLAAGLIGCLLFGFVVWSWGATRTRAQAMAADMVDSLNRQKAELLRSNHELEQFAYVASHDLRAPLRNISFLTSWLVEDHGDELVEAAREKLDDLAKCTGRMDALLNSILAYSRLSSADTERQVVDAGSLVAEAIGLIGPPARMTVGIEDDLPDFEGSPARMSQVFANLIGNAIKHHDRPEGRITVSGAVKGEDCEFRITDDGPGIDPKFRDRVFEMFKTLRSRDEVEGSGMGLAIVRKTIEQHGGRIWIESNGDARGTSFVFTVNRGTSLAGP